MRLSPCTTPPSAEGGSGVPQVKLEQYGEVVAAVLEGLVARPKADRGAELATLALQHLGVVCQGGVRVACA
jgi:hypothetical protein